MKPVSKTSAVASRSGFLPDRVIHLHPTRLCNLQCLHCYSESSPQQQAVLDPAVVCDALALLRAEGYTQISLSGGEPLVYRPLCSVVRKAKELGFRVTIVSNGLLVTKRMEEVLSLMDGIAISFDGLAASHNAMRGRPDAFERACEAVYLLATMERPVAAAISLTANAIHELPDLADKLVSLGARALQIRPVARAGRARLLMDTSFYNSDKCARLYLVMLALREELPADIRIHCDLAPAQGLWQQRDAYGGLLGDCGVVPYQDRPLADLINPLVITETGSVKPIAYDFDALYDVASIDGLSSSCLQTYKQMALSDLQQLIGGALTSLQSRQDLVDWFDLCTRMSALRRGTNPKQLGVIGSN